MATIYNPPQMSQASQQPQATGSNPQSDPLFDALVKYITSAPGASSTTSDELQSIIDTHSEMPGGRAYLESIVSDDQPPPMRIWKYMSEAHGFVSTNMDSLTLNFTAPQAYVRFNGAANGFFGMSAWPFKSAKLFYDSRFERVQTVDFEVKSYPRSQLVIVQFFAEVGIDRQAIAQLAIDKTGLVLPPYGAKGKGVFTPIIIGSS